MSSWVASLKSDLVEDVKLKAAHEEVFKRLREEDERREASRLHAEEVQRRNIRAQVQRDRRIAKENRRARAEVQARANSAILIFITRRSTIYKELDELKAGALEMIEQDPRCEELLVEFFKRQGEQVENFVDVFKIIEVRRVNELQKEVSDSIDNKMARATFRQLTMTMIRPRPTRKIDEIRYLIKSMQPKRSDVFKPILLAGLAQEARSRTDTKKIYDGLFRGLIERFENTHDRRQRFLEEFKIFRTPVNESIDDSFTDTMGEIEDFYRGQEFKLRMLELGEKKKNWPLKGIFKRNQEDRPMILPTATTVETEPLSPLKLEVDPFQKEPGETFRQGKEEDPEALQPLTPLKAEIGDLDYELPPYKYGARAFYEL